MNIELDQLAKAMEANADVLRKFDQIQPTTYDQILELAHETCHLLNMEAECQNTISPNQEELPLNINLKLQS